ncbi:MAG: hypothetical protein KGL39_40795 [Patescibacteria group bacterium]|nr:hypothetical protein [Patescibacteria group bacterium]
MSKRMTEAKVSAMTSYCARKGDACAVELRHSMTYVHGRTERRSTWHVGTVLSASRDGIVKTVRVMLPTESGKPFERVCREYDRDKGYGWSAYTISDPVARLAASEMPPAEYRSADEIKAAILGETKQAA